ncbi:MAG: histidine kinase [Microbacteriaceae bacterium]|nr:histidine kinase [Microbacteriaceae bacterium]
MAWLRSRRRKTDDAAPAAATTMPATAAPAPAPAPTERVEPAAASPARSRRPLSPRARTTVFWVVLGLIAAGLYAVEVPLSVGLYRVPVEIVFVVVAAHVGALALAVWRPREASVLAVVAVLVLMLLSTGGTGAPWPWAVAPLITQSLVLAVVAWKDTWWWSLAAWAASCVASVLVAFVFISHRDLGASMTNVIVFANIAVFVLAAAVVVRQLQRTRAQLVTERSTSSAERERRQVLDERARIARELHDVVAHGMSILNVQATSAPYRHPGLPAEVVAEFEQIAAQTRTTLAEMRRLLGVLRSDEGVEDVTGAGPASAGAAAPPRSPARDTKPTEVLGVAGSGIPAGRGATSPTVVLEPQPGLAQLPALIEQARAAGAEILFQPGEALGHPVDDVVGLAAYRIVQEGLSNALRHAPGAAITVQLERDSRMLEVAVVNVAPTRTVRASTGQLAGAGFGLQGMRERAAAVGGSVEYGPMPGGGYRVDAVLPATAGGAS